MSLSRNSVQRAGDRAFFISREIASGSRPQCLREQIHYEIQFGLIMFESW